MSELSCGCILMTDLIPFKKKIYEENGELKEIIYMNHKHHHLVDVSGDNERKTELFNQGEKLKLQISKKQFNILTGEDTETNCILDCPYKDLFKSAVILMPSEVRRVFAEQWGEMEEAVDMVEEVEREEREDMEREENLTREPDTDEESEEDEEEEEDDEKDEDETDYDELKAYLKTLTEEQRIKHRNFETLRNTANGFRPDYRMEKIYKAIKELKREEEEAEESENDSVLEEMRWVAREHSDWKWMT